MIYIIGSTLLGLSNTHDIDYICSDAKEKIVNQPNTIYHGCRADSLSIVENRIQKFINYETTTTGIYQFDYRIIKQDFPIHFDILNYKNQIICMLKRVIKNLPPKSKQWYHVLYLYYILENNSVTLTSEQFENVQKAHDRVIDNEIISDIKIKIKKLKLN